MKRILCVVAAACSGAPHIAIDAADEPPPGFYVAPDGDDANPGTFDAPFATIQRAIDAARGSTEKHVNVRAGTYELRGRSIALDARDGGLELLGYPGELPVVSGGFSITGWTAVDANIWAADLPPELADVGAVTVDGAWLDVARTPDRDPSDPHASWFFVEQSLGPPTQPWEPSFNQDNAFTYRGDDLAAIGDEPDAWVSIWDKLGWSADILKIASVEGGAVHLEAASQFGLAANSRYFVYGLRSALDRPNEYYVDRAAHRLLLVGDPTASHVVASPYNGPPLISIDGADGVHIAGLDLRDQHNTGRWGVPAGGGVKLVSGNAAWIEGNRLHALGVGVDVEAGTGHRLERNTVFDIACSGIALFGDASTIAGNTIHDTGLVEPASHGVIVGPGRNVIAHNRISDVPHYGIIAVGDRADGLVIEYNVLERVDTGANDAGAIYLKNRGNYNPAARETVRYNRIVGSGGLAVGTDTAFTSPGFSFGIYLDDGQTGTDVYGNLFVGTAAGAVFAHNGTDNHIYNNVMIDGVYRQLYVESSNVPQGNVFERNILVSSTRAPTVLVKQSGEEATLRGNLYYDPAEPAYFDQVFYAYSDGRTLAFADAAAAGLVTDSVVADPRFVDPEHGDYRLAPDSPAPALGFIDLPYAEMGP